MEFSFWNKLGKYQISKYQGRSLRGFVNWCCSILLSKGNLMCFHKQRLGDSIALSHFSITQDISHSCYLYLKCSLVCHPSWSYLSKLITWSGSYIRGYEPSCPAAAWLSNGWPGLSIPLRQKLLMSHYRTTVSHLKNRAGCAARGKSSWLPGQYRCYPQLWRLIVDKNAPTRKKKERENFLKLKQRQAGTNSATYSPL